MFTRTSSALGLLLLSACDAKLPDKPPEMEGQPDLVGVATAEDKIDCAAPGDTEMAPVCTIDRVEIASGPVLTLRRPDGGFHRLLITRDGSGVVAADGAEQAVVKPLAANLIEVELSGARYRLPATVRAVRGQAAR
jgi:hypothetical protein